VLKLANIKSQIKRNKTNEKARQRNKAVRTEVRSYVRVVRENIAAGKKDEAQQAYAVAARKLDKAVSKGVLHKNNAANRKSRLATQINAL
jgi:small subunit ribosomal protein S20